MEHHVQFGHSFHLADVVHLGVVHLQLDHYPGQGQDPPHDGFDCFGLHVSHGQPVELHVPALDSLALLRYPDLLPDLLDLPGYFALLLGCPGIHPGLLVQLGSLALLDY